MDDFDYGKAEADLYDVGCPHSEEIFEYQTERGRNEFLRENGLDPEKYHKNGNDAGSGNGNSGGCYLTTACVVAKGLPDNCMELETLRSYRDGYLKGREGGLADIETYYSVAPKIVDAINALADSNSIWQDIYNHLVLPCVELIGKGQMEEAYKLYKESVSGLSSKYLGKEH